MTDEIIGSDSPLTSAQRDTLTAFANALIPPSEDGRMPGAGEIDVLTYVRETASELITQLGADMDDLDARSRDRHSTPFTDLLDADQQALIAELRRSEPRLTATAMRETVACYYQDDRVLLALGMEPRPPFPQGYEVKSGDISLLDPVIERGRMFRDDGTA